MGLAALLRGCTAASPRRNYFGSCATWSCASWSWQMSSVVVADVLLSPAEQGVPVKILLNIAAAKMAGGSKVGT